MIRKTEELRQPYLDSLLKGCPPSVDNIVYDNTGEKSDEYLSGLVDKGLADKEIADKHTGLAPKRRPHMVVVGTPQILGRGLKQPIFVSDAAFRVYGVESLFLNVLIDHECVHASDFMNGITVNSLDITYRDVDEFNPFTCITLMEYHAFNVQIARLQKRNITRRDFIDDMLLRRSFVEDALKKTKPKTNFERYVIEQTLKTT